MGLQKNALFITNILELELLCGCNGVFSTLNWTLQRWIVEFDVVELFIKSIGALSQSGSEEVVCYLNLIDLSTQLDNKRLVHVMWRHLLRLHFLQIFELLKSSLLMVFGLIPLWVNSIEIFEKFIGVVVDLVSERSSVQLSCFATSIVSFGGILSFEILQDIQDVSIFKSSFEMTGSDVECVSQPRLQPLSWVMDLLDIRQNQWLS